MAAACAIAPAAGSAAVEAGQRPPPCGAITTLGMETCFEGRTRAVDRGIVAAVRRIGSARSNAAARRLLASQRAWAAYRRAECRSRGDLHEGGSISGVEAAACRLDLGRARLAALRVRLRALQGD